MLTILTVAADESRRVSMIDALAGRGNQHVISVATLEAALIRMQRQAIDVVIVDRPEVEPHPLLDTLQTATNGRFPLIVLEPDSGRPFSSLRADPANPPWPVDWLSFELEIGNDKKRIPKVVELLIHQALRLTWLSPQDGDRARVSLEEALMNAVIHGNLEVHSDLRERDDDAFEAAIAERLLDARYSPRRVSIGVLGDQRRVRWVIRDEGPGFDVRKVPDPRTPERLTLASGRGVLLMRALMDRVHYNERGNEVELVKLNPRRAASSAVCSGERPSSPELLTVR